LAKLRNDTFEVMNWRCFSFTVPTLGERVGIFHMLRDTARAFSYILSDTISR